MTFFNKKSTFVPYIKGRDITVVNNYSALPDPTTVGDKFYWCENSQGTAWLPGSLGGTYYPRGLYYSNGTTWEYMETPIQATQAEVDAGIIDDRFVSPNTLYNADQWNSVKVKLFTNSAVNDVQNILNLVEGSNMTITDDGAGNITFDATGGGGDLTVVGNGVIVTGTPDNTFSKALLVPANSYVVNDAPEVIVRVNRTGLATASFITRLYWNVTPDIVGNPILISTLQTTGGGNRFNQFTRTLSIENATSSTFSTGSTNPTDFGFVTPAQVSLAIDWTQNGYLVVSISATSSGDAQCCNLIKIRK